MIGEVVCFDGTEEMRQKCRCSSEVFAGNAPLPLYRCYHLSIAGRTGNERVVLAGECPRTKEFQCVI
jgi:hypothetical protein